MNISTKIRASTMDVLPFNRVEVGSVFEHVGEVLFKFSDRLGFRLRDGSHYSFSLDEEVSVVTIRVSRV